MRLLRSVALVAVFVVGCASMASSAPVKSVDGVLTGNNGMTLYTFDKDVQAGKSVCNGTCSVNWPPLYASDADVPSGDYSIIVRDDGKKQWALKGKPLYFWSKDAKPGDKTGDGVINAWHIARP